MKEQGKLSFRYLKGPSKISPIGPANSRFINVFEDKRDEVILPQVYESGTFLSRPGGGGS